MVREFAALHRVCERTARNWRAAGDKRWADFVNSWRVGTEEKIPVSVEVARRTERAAGEMLTRLQNVARREDDPTRLESLAKAIERARRTWEHARKDLQRVEEEAGLLVPVSAVRELQQQLVGQLGLIWKAWPDKVAGDLHPGMRPAFFEAVRKNSRDWDAKIEEIDSALEALLC